MSLCNSCKGLLSFHGESEKVCWVLMVVFVFYFSGLIGFKTTSFVLNCQLLC